MDMVIKSSEDDYLIREILLTHDPDGRKLDSDTLLQLVENTFSSAAAPAENVLFLVVGVAPVDIEAAELDEAVSVIISRITKEILSLCFKDKNLHSKVLMLLEMFSRYRWDAKLVLALAAFAEAFGLFWLIGQNQSKNALAASLATVKQLPRAISALKPQFKALTSLTHTMMKVTKLIVGFESWHLQHEFLDVKSIDYVKSKIYMATYWILRSILECSSQISDLRASRFECPNETVTAACALHSLGMKLSSICHDLKDQVDICHQQIDKRLNQKLQDMFKGRHIDNQEALGTLFAFKHEYPLKLFSSQEKYFSVLELKGKIVILLISKPELLPIETIFWLVQWTYNHPQHKKFEESYAIVWVPVSLSNTWSLTDKTNYQYISNSLPWFSIRKPWSLSPLVVNYIRRDWKFSEDSRMVVLNENGYITNTNAMNMVWVWGPQAFPFSASKERELWEEKSWTLDHLISGINSLLTEWVEAGKNLCIYGSEDLDWIREFTAVMEKIKSAGIQLEVIYVGCRYPGENVKNIINTIDQENLCTSLIFSKVDLFWFRLECIKRSLGVSGSDEIRKEVAKLLDFSNNKESWVLIGKGSSSDVIQLEATKLEKCLDHFPIWSKNVEAYGLVGAIRNALGFSFPGGPCDHTELVQYEEEPAGKIIMCSSCKQPCKQKFVLFKCDGNTEKLDDSVST